MTQYHEPTEELSSEDRDIIRALVSMKEELEAVDWYHQRASVCSDQGLKDVLIHNRNEEIEHAVMALEWLRRKIPEFDSNLRTYLFKDAPITEIEEEIQSDEQEDSDGSSATSDPSGLGIGQLS